MVTETEAQSQTKCAHCGGNFPGQGVEREGKVYCCDMCAQENQKTWKKPVQWLALTGAFLATFFLGRKMR